MTGRIAVVVARRSLAVGCSVLLLLIGLVVHHRLSIALPRSGNAVRASGEASITVTQGATKTSTTSLLELHDQSGAVTTAWLREPLHLATDYKVLLTYVGHETGRGILDLIPERDDLVLLAMQYPFVYGATWSEKLMLPTRLNEAAGFTVTGGMLAIAELQNRGFEVDRLTVLGVSFGSYFAILHGAYDELVPRTLVVHGGGDIRGVLTSAFSHRGQPWTGRLLGALGFLFLDPLDPVHHISRLAPGSLVLVAARGDPYFPEHGIQRLYERARPPKAIVWNTGAHVRSSRPDIVAHLVVQIDAYLDGRLQFDESEGFAGNTAPTL